MQYTFVVVLGIIGQIFGALVVPRAHSTNHHHEANEIDQALFFYDGQSHNLVLKLSDHCYLEKLNVHQRARVHTAEGLQSLETSFMSLIAKGVKTPVNHDQLSDLSQHVEHMCAGATVYSVSSHHHHHTTTIAQ